MAGAPSERDVACYYRGALLGLRFLEGQKPTGRRFGPEADARWASFRGDLTTADRIDLMIRDANAQWPEAFGARTTFGMRAVAEDEPFGPGFVPLDPVEAEELWRRPVATPGDTQGLLGAVAAAWDLKLSAHEVGTIGAADKVVVVGPSAIAALIVAFRAGRDLDFCDQVLVVASPPAHRQLAALAGAVLGSTKPTRFAGAGDRTSLRGYRLVASGDADAADLAQAKELVG